MKKIFALIMAVLMMAALFTGCITNDDKGPGENKYNLKTVKEGYLTVLTSPDYAPYEFYALDENGDPALAGFDMALAKYIADYLGLTLEVVPMDFKGIPDEMGNGKGDLAIAGLSPDPDRLLKMDFSDIYYDGKQAFVTTKDQLSKVTDLASTNSAEFEIAAQSGTIQEELAKQYSPNAQYTALTKATDIIAELNSGKIDGAYIEWDVAAAYQANYPNLAILCQVPYEAEGNVIGVAKGNADLLKYVNEALNKCVDDGDFAQFVKTALEQAAGDKFEGFLDPDGNIPTEGK